MNLFEHADTYPNCAGSKTGGASQEAAALVERTSAPTIRAAVLKHLQRGYVQTAEEISVAVQRPLHSVRSRLSELMECGLIEKLEDRGQGESGVRIHKWRVI